MPNADSGDTIPLDFNDSPDSESTDGPADPTAPELIPLFSIDENEPEPSTTEGDDSEPDDEAP